MHRLRQLAGAALLLVLSGACANNHNSVTDQKIVVFAASSLTEAFEEVRSAFVAAHSGTAVTINFAGSADLAAQIQQGAPADVFASADEANMAKLVDVGEIGATPQIVARNTFAIIVEPGNPRGIAAVADLARPDLIVVLCAGTVPCGAGAQRVLRNAEVTVAPKSLEDKVTGVVSKVASGEADAGIVFATDIRAHLTRVDEVSIPADLNAVTSYPIAVTTASAGNATAQLFVEFVAGPNGQAILQAHGFLAA
jgi:molybdate transport system substrate-binding protein